MPLLSPSEKSALELMLRNKLGSGAGTSALLKVLEYVDVLYAHHSEPLDVAVEAMPSGRGTPAYDAAPLISELTDVPPMNAPEVVVTESSP